MAGRKTSNTEAMALAKGMSRKLNTELGRRKARNIAKTARDSGTSIAKVGKAVSAYKNITNSMLSPHKKEAGKGTPSIKYGRKKRAAGMGSSKGRKKR